MEIKFGVKHLTLIAGIALVFLITIIFYLTDDVSPRLSSNVLPFEKELNTVTSTSYDSKTISKIIATDTEGDITACIEQTIQFTTSDEFLACLDSIIPYTDDEDVTAIAKTLIAPWMVVDWRSALTYILSLQDHHRDYLMEWAIGLMDIENVNQGIAWVAEQNLSPVQQTDYLTALFLQLAKDDPETAIFELDSFYDLQLKNSMLASIIQLWGRKNAQEALLWLASQVDSDIFRNAEFSSNEFYRQLKSHVEWQFIQQHPMSAAEYIQNMQLGDDKVILSSYYADYLANIDFYNALTWAKNLNEYPVYQVAIQAILEVGSHSDNYQLEVLTLASEQEDPVFRDALLANVSIQISATNIEKMVEFLPSLPESAQVKVIHSITLAWLEKDKEQMIDWLYSIPEGGVEVSAKKVIVQNLVGKETTRAFEIAVSISEPTQRLAVLKSTINYLATQDLQQALFELEQLDGISEEERAKLSQELDNIQ